jgi:hypothetical protein
MRRYLKKGREDRTSQGYHQKEKEGHRHHNQEEVTEETSCLPMLGPGLKGGDKFGNGGLNSIGRHRDEHKKGHQGIEVPVVNRSKVPHHEKMIEEVEQVEETNTNEHQSCMSDKLIPES